MEATVAWGRGPATRGSQRPALPPKRWPATAPASASRAAAWTFVAVPLLRAAGLRCAGIALALAAVDAGRGAGLGGSHRLLAAQGGVDVKQERQEAARGQLALLQQELQLGCGVAKRSPDLRR
jgi:hypothetical protein